MNEPTCHDARRWLAMSREGGDDAPVGIRFHLDRCPACARLAARYDAGVSALARATATRGGRLPEASAVIAAARRPERSRLGRWVFAGAAVASAAVIVLVSAPGGTDPEGAAPEGIATAPATAADGQTPRPPSAVAPWEATRLTTAAAPRELRDPVTATLRVAPETDLSLPAWSDGEAEVALTRGTVSVSVVPRVGEQRFTVRTEELAATVVGTAFSVTRAPDEGTRVVVREGVVYVEVRAGGAVTLGAGDVMVVAPPREPRPPERAAEPPEVAAPALVPAPSELRAEPLTARIQAARRLLARGRSEEAIALLGALVPGDDADRASVAALLGDAWTVAGELARARDAYADAARWGRGPVALGAVAELARTQAALGEREAAAASWRRLLDAAPDGPLAPRALAALGEDASLLARFPESREATGALLRLGRARLDAGRWEDAAALFSAHLGDPQPERREVALVGLMRARLGQGRRDAVAALVARYDAAFPAGARRAEVERVRAAAGL
ncbi:MAG: hypothetical protein CVU56_13955 [Deltaproteobacteria bacterium HGW-Deltaproteobacteria-14]|nr:MAG: hypothetical protein CVU56_13955 [Deltaproteobacteria bacterium HGW-Deltaproteobacteria-14]